MQSPLWPAHSDLLAWIANPDREWDRHCPGRRAFGYLCTYAPLELMHAAGFAPVRIMQSTGSTMLAEAHLPSFSCALARSVTEQMLQGKLDFLQGVLFTHTCDTLQCLADIWRLASPHFPVLTFSFPTVLEGVAARTYLRAELQRLVDSLETRTCTRLTSDRLRASIAVYNAQRRLLASVYARSEDLSALQLWFLATTGMLLPVEEHNALLRGFLDGLQTAATSARRGPRLLVVGAMLDDPLVPGLMDELGARLVGDDLCGGSRYWDTLVDEQHEPLDALAERYMRRAACPAKHAPGQSRADRLMGLVRSQGAQGVVFLQTKFCDPHAFEYVPLSQALGAAGVPHLLLETEGSESAGQMRTRLQAFVELLDSGG